MASQTLTVTVAKTENLALAAQIADSLLPPPGTAEESAEMQKYVIQLNRASAVIIPDIINVVIAPKTSKEKAYYLRRELYERIDECFDILGKAKSSGISVPNNPFVLLMQKNASRQLFSPISLSAAEADQVINDVNVLVKFVSDVKKGKYKLKENPLSSYAQISSYAVGVEGYENRSINDLLGYSPGGDSVKLNKALESLNSLNFSKRIPRLLFTADFSPDGETSKGAIVGWKKMLDASGYVLTRHNVFENIDDSISLTNEQLKNTTEAVREYMETWILSFYEGSDSKMIYAWLDTTAEKDKMYTYTLKAYQNSMPTAGSIFVVNKMPVQLTPAKMEEARQEILKVISARPSYRVSAGTLAVAGIAATDFTVARGLSTRISSVIQAADAVRASAPIAQSVTLIEDGISPYPHLSKKIYGDPNYDWILAAINVRASFERKDNIQKIKSFSYLGSKFSFIKDEMSNGNFYVPEDLGLVVKRVEEAISSFGLTRTLIDIFDAAGLLFFFGEKEVPQDGLQTTAVLEGSMLSVILSAIDPETATIDPKTLATNMNATIKSASRGSAIISKMRELDMTLDTSHFENDVIADDAAQFVGELKVDGNLIDLTTFEGISRLIRTIRTYFDFNMNRGK